MKKTYIMPSMKVKEVKLATIIAASLGCSDTEYSGKVYSKQSADLGFDDQESDKSWGAIW